MSSVEKAIVAIIEQRAKKGLETYGVTLDRTDYPVEQGISDAIEEALDLAIYLQKCKQEIAKLRSYIQELEVKIRTYEQH
jgi:hypothetical protein